MFITLLRNLRVWIDPAARWLLASCDQHVSTMLGRYGFKKRIAFSTWWIRGVRYSDGERFLEVSNETEYGGLICVCCWPDKDTETGLTSTPDRPIDVRYLFESEPEAAYSLIAAQAAVQRASLVIERWCREGKTCRVNPPAKTRASESTALAENDVILLVRALPGSNIPLGSMGAVLLVYETPIRAYEVEFVNERGEEYPDTFTVTDEDIRLK